MLRSGFWVLDVFCEIDVRLIVKEEEGIRSRRNSLVPAGGIPGPGDAFFGKLIANRHLGLRGHAERGVRQRVGVDIVNRVAVRSDNSFSTDAAVWIKGSHDGG